MYAAPDQATPRGVGPRGIHFRGAGRRDALRDPRRGMPPRRRWLNPGGQRRPSIQRQARHGEVAVAHVRPPCEQHAHGRDAFVALQDDRGTFVALHRPDHLGDHDAFVAELRIERALIVVAHEREVARGAATLVDPATSHQLAVSLDREPLRAIPVVLAELGHDPALFAEARVGLSVRGEAHEGEVVHVVSGDDDSILLVDGDRLRARRSWSR